MNPKVDEFVAKQKSWKKEVQKLREIALEFGLNEELKWETPCFDFEKNNIGLIGCFKEYCAFSFFKGALLSDKTNILVSPRVNSQSVRLLKFTNLHSIKEQESVLKQFLTEAIEIEKLGTKVTLKKADELELVEELIQKMAGDSELKLAFNSLTPGRQRGYNLFFEAAKQSKTRQARIEKYLERIKSGKGINDCVCGHSNKMPGCDGSHKYL